MIIIDEEAIKALEDAIDRLDTRQETAIRQRYWDDLTIREIAKNMSVTRERVRQILLRGERKLRCDRKLRVAAGIEEY